MSTVYTRTIRIVRPTPVASLGATDYSGARSWQEKPLASSIQAAIQYKSQGKASGADLPGDTVGRSMWRILIPIAGVSRGLIQVRDLIYDDTNIRYQVTAPYYTAYGYQLLCERLES